MITHNLFPLHLIKHFFTWPIFSYIQGTRKENHMKKKIREQQQKVKEQPLNFNSQI